MLAARIKGHQTRDAPGTADRAGSLIVFGFGRLVERKNKIPFRHQSALQETSSPLPRNDEIGGDFVAKYRSPGVLASFCFLFTTA